MRKNPFREARQKLNLKLADVALKSGVSLTTVLYLEKGVTKRINPKILEFYTKQGFDAKGLASDYEAFRQLQKQG